LRRPILDHPARIIPLAFLAAIVVGTGLLLLPLSSADSQVAPILTAVFTATSAVCVTGLIVVDTATYWSPLGSWPARRCWA
jgi:trk system potassium uptake protein